MDAYENVTALLVPTRAFRIPENTPNLSERRGFDPRSVYRLWNRLFLMASF